MKVTRSGILTAIAMLILVAALPHQPPSGGVVACPGIYFPMDRSLSRNCARSGSGSSALSAACL